MPVTKEDRIAIIIVPIVAGSSTTCRSTFNGMWRTQIIHEIVPKLTKKFKITSLIEDARRSKKLKTETDEYISIQLLAEGVQQKNPMSLCSNRNHPKQFYARFRMITKWHSYKA